MPAGWLTMTPPHRPVAGGRETRRRRERAATLGDLEGRHGEAGSSVGQRVDRARPGRGVAGDDPREVADLGRQHAVADRGRDRREGPARLGLVERRRRIGRKTRVVEGNAHGGRRREGRAMRCQRIGRARRIDPDIGQCRHCRAVARDGHVDGRRQRAGGNRDTRPIGPGHRPARRADAACGRR